MKNSNIITTTLFGLFIGIFFVIQVITPDNSFSQYENRNLSTKPEFTVDSFISGKYNSSLDSYLSDQFPYRNFWISLKASNEYLLGKSENGLVHFTDDYTLIDTFSPVDFTIVDSNLSRIDAFVANIDVPVFLSLIPTQSDIYKYKLNPLKTYESQEDVLDYIYRGYSSDQSSSMTNITDDSLSMDSDYTLIDVYQNLMEHRNEYIYYNTDHHWTSLGAYYAYELMGEALAYNPVSLTDLNKQIVSTTFQGTTHSKSPIPWIKKDSIITYYDNQNVLIYSHGELIDGLMYDETKLQNKNQYEYFLGGNPPLVIVAGTGSGTLLLIRDSYSNALVPFLTPHYESIHMIDLRTNKYSMSEYIDANDIEQVLICYSIPNFVTDKNLAFLR